MAASPQHGVDFELGLRLCAGRPALYDNIVKRFLCACGNATAEMRSSVDRGDPGAAAHLAHQQVSTANLIGANALAGAARALQRSFSAGDSAQWPELFSSYDQQLAIVVTELEGYISKSV